MAEWRISIMLVVMLTACGTASDEEAQCLWFEVCGEGCANCDDNNECTEDRCIDRVFCGHVSLGNACDCVPNCHPGDGRISLAQVLSQGEGGLPNLDGISDIAVTSDEKNLYVAAKISEAITVFLFQDNALRRLGSINVGGVSGLALSSDEKRLFSVGKGGLRVFERDENGLLSLRAKVAAEGHGVAVTGPWIATADGSEIRLYRMGPSDSELVLERTISGEQLAGVRNLVFSPDGRHLYAASFDASLVTAWEVGVGALNFIGEIGGQRGLLNPDGIAISPAGTHLYVAGYCDHDVAILSRDSNTGELGYLGSAFNEGPRHTGCELLNTEEPEGSDQHSEDIQPMNPSSIAVGPDSAYVMVAYVAPITHFDILKAEGDTLTGVDSISGSYAYLDKLGLGAQRLGGWSGFVPPVDNVDARHSVGAVVTQNGYWSSSSFTSSVSRFVLQEANISILQEAEILTQKGYGGIANLAGAYTLDLSPDGRHLYVGPRHHDRPGVFAVDAETGVLRELPSPVLPAVSGEGRDDPIEKGAVGHVYVVRPHGKMVVATESRQGDLHFFNRDVDSGLLTHLQAVPLPECDRKRPFPADVVSSPDGKSIYVADFQVSSPSCIYHYALGEDGLPIHMTRYSESWLGGIETFAQTQAGDHLYAACFEAQSIAHYKRDLASGELLAQAPIIRDDLEGVEIMAMTPDERFLYATSPVIDSLVVFARDPATGALTHVETHTNVEGVSLDGAAGIVTSPDGNSLYVAARQNDAISNYRIGSDGKLSLIEITSDLPSLDWVNGVRVSADGRFLYSTAVGANAVSVFKVLNGKDDGCGGLCP